MYEAIGAVLVMEGCMVQRLVVVLLVVRVVPLMACQPPAQPKPKVITWEKGGSDMVQIPARIIFQRKRTASRTA